MTRLLIPLFAGGAFAAAFAALPAPAAAQNNVAEVIVYGNDPCPRSTDDEIVVCARKPEHDRYRIPEQYRPAGPRQKTESWAERATSLETAGATGTMSCSPVGPGGYTGCLTKMIDQARKQAKQQSKSSTPPE